MPPRAKGCPTTAPASGGRPWWRDGIRNGIRRRDGDPATGSLRGGDDERQRDSRRASARPFPARHHPADPELESELGFALFARSGPASVRPSGASCSMRRSSRRSPAAAGTRPRGRTGQEARRSLRVAATPRWPPACAAAARPAGMRPASPPDQRLAGEGGPCGADRRRRTGRHQPAARTPRRDRALDRPGRLRGGPACRRSARRACGGAAGGLLAGASSPCTIPSACAAARTRPSRAPAWCRPR